VSKKKKMRTMRIFKKRPCKLCRDKVESIDFMQVELLEKYLSDRGRIVSSRINGNCAKHQRMVARAIKKARLAALLPFVTIREASSTHRRPRRHQR
jgi:small subunit ribosomal protein S18